jgi:hypothetical protein
LFAYFSNNICDCFLFSFPLCGTQLRCEEKQGTEEGRGEQEKKMGHNCVRVRQLCESSQKKKKTQKIEAVEEWEKDSLLFASFSSRAHRTTPTTTQGGSLCHLIRLPPQWTTLLQR